MAQLSIYNGSVTSGGTNGTLITTGDILKTATFRVLKLLQIPLPVNGG